jgi:Sec-independent protein translocase protein TatA
MEERVFGLSAWHILILAIVLFLLWGGRISDAMHGFGASIGRSDSRLNRFIPPLWQRVLRSLFR